MVQVAPYPGPVSVPRTHSSFRWNSSSFLRRRFRRDDAWCPRGRPCRRTSPIVRFHAASGVARASAHPNTPQLQWCHLPRCTSQSRTFDSAHILLDISILKVYHPFAMRIALHPLTFKDAFLKEERAVAVAFRTAPLPGVGRAVLHLQIPPSPLIGRRLRRLLWRIGGRSSFRTSHSSLHRLVTCDRHARLHGPSRR